MLSFIANPQNLGEEVGHKTLIFGASIRALPYPEGIELAPNFHSFCPKRQEEFLAGRCCAVEALKELTEQGEVVLPCDSSGLPIWPEGFTGSITHDSGIARAAVVATEKWRGIGIDSQRLVQGELEGALARKILTSEDRSLFARIDFLAASELLTLAFSAKESLYKCLYPLCKSYFYFSSAAFTLLAPDGNFTLALIRDINCEFSAGYSLKGYYALADGNVHTMVEDRNFYEGNQGSHLHVLTSIMREERREASSR